jgi:hypothetical protein
MTSMPAVSIAALVLAVLAVPTAYATVHAASRDPCAAIGNETSHAPAITIPSGAPVRRGFDFGTPVVSIRKIEVRGAARSRATTRERQSRPDGGRGAVR